MELQKKKNKTISLRIDEELLEKIDKKTIEKEVNRSELINFILKKYIDEV